MSLLNKAQEIKNTLVELYEIFSDKAESERRDAEFSERIKQDENYLNIRENVLTFPQKTKKDENRDISAI